jgi:transposase-like protein
MSESQVIRKMIDITNAEIKKAEAAKIKIERDLISYHSMITMIQGMCPHVDEDGETTTIEVGHTHNDTRYRCTICGEEYNG